MVECDVRVIYVATVNFCDVIQYVAWTVTLLTQAEHRTDIGLPTP